VKDYSYVPLHNQGDPVGTRLPCFLL
jgi:hypothetical protein